MGNFCFDVTLSYRRLERPRRGDQAARTRATSAVEQRQHILRLLVKDVLIGPEKITIRHRIPIRERTTAPTSNQPAPTRRATIA
jgi:hypothetical protein